VAMVEPGSMFGHYALIDSRPRGATILALQDSKLMTIHKKEFDLIQPLFNQDMIQRKKFLTGLLPEIDELGDENNQRRFF
jgi:CRP-like cAMP-binding protein